METGLNQTTIAIASDLSGYALKQAIAAHLAAKPGVCLLDFGIESEDKPSPYFEQAPKVAAAIQDGRAEKGILICGTGQGMAIVANKHKGIYACVVSDLFSGERAKIINNANVITLGGWITARSWPARSLMPGWRWPSRRRWNSNANSSPTPLTRFRTSKTAFSGVEPMLAQVATNTKIVAVESAQELSTVIDYLAPGAASVVVIKDKTPVAARATR